MSGTTAAAASTTTNADVADALASLPDDTLRCRFYEQQYPDVEDIVVVQVKSIAEMGAYVSLLEYNEIEGMILLSELSRRRMRSITKLIRVGRVEYVVVLRVDKEKGYIDLSKRRVAPEDVAKADKKYTKAKAVHSLLRHIAQARNVKLEEMYKQIAWPLARAFEHAYEAFKLAIVEPDKVFTHLPDLAPDLKEQLLKEILERLTPQAVRVRADVEVTCFAYEGIDAVKAALRAAIAAQTEHMPVKVKLLSPPHYVMWCAAIDKEAGIELLEKAISRAEAVIKEKNGELVVKIAPRAVTEREDAELTRIDEEDEEESDSGDD